MKDPWKSHMYAINVALVRARLAYQVLSNRIYGFVLPKVLQLFLRLREN